MKHLIMTSIAILLASCVSVSLPSSNGQKAKDVEVTEPVKPFVEIKSKDADRSWLSSAFGNTISYLSDCNNQMDPPVQQIESESLAVLSNLKIINSNNFNFNSREASDTLAQGEVDGVSVKMRIVTFKKNNCSYSIIYGGVANRFDRELPNFNDFLKGFKAP